MKRLKTRNMSNVTLIGPQMSCNSNKILNRILHRTRQTESEIYMGLWLKLRKYNKDWGMSFLAYFMTI